MIKLKDNVPFKELRKYGFEDDGDDWTHEIIRASDMPCCLFFDKKDRRLLFASDDVGDESEIALNTIFDLAIDGLLEKVPHKYNEVIEVSRNEWWEVTDERHLKPFDLAKFMEGEDVERFEIINTNDFGDITNCEVYFNDGTIKCYKLQ